MKRVEKEEETKEMPLEIKEQKDKANYIDIVEKDEAAGSKTGNFIDKILNMEK